MQPVLIPFDPRLIAQAQPIRVWARVTLYLSTATDQFDLLLDDGSVLDKAPALKRFSFTSESARTAYVNERYPYARATDPALTPEQRSHAHAERDSARVKCKICEG